MSSLPTTVTRQRRDCDLNPGPSAPESSKLTTGLNEVITAFYGIVSYNRYRGNVTAVMPITPCSFCCASHPALNIIARRWWCMTTLGHMLRAL